MVRGIKLTLIKLLMKAQKINLPSLIRAKSSKSAFFLHTHTQRIKSRLQRNLSKSGGLCGSLKIILTLNRGGIGILGSFERLIKLLPLP